MRSNIPTISVDLHLLLIPVDNLILTMHVTLLKIARKHSCQLGARNLKQEAGKLGQHVLNL